MTSPGTAAGAGFLGRVIMAIGSAFAATNTMYAAVAPAAREIGTLRALGFGAGRSFARSCSNRSAWP